MEKTGRKAKYLAMIINIYVLLVGVGVPLVVRDRYFDILVVKYYYYCICTILLVVCLIIYFVITHQRSTIYYLKRCSFKMIINNLSISDMAIILFWIIAVVSTFTSDYVYESFWGNEGRFTGLFLITWYVISYFCVSRLWELNKIYIDIILGTGIIVCLFGITDYFNLDILKFKAPMIEEQRAIFTSTIGNINTYTAYVGIIMAISSVLFALNKDVKRSAFYLTSMVISFFAIIMGASDNAYLTLAALFAILPLYLFNSKSGIQKYLFILATFLTVIQCVKWVNILFVNSVIGLDSVFNMVINFGGLHIMIISLWMIIIIWKIFDFKLSKGDRGYSNIFKFIWLLILCIVFIGIVYIIYDINVLGNVNKYGKLKMYFLFNDDWGTHRGYIWRNAIESFSNLTIWKKTFGFGPETFGILLLQKTTNNPYNQIFDSAHNEYLHLLITVGFAGLITYLIFIADYIRNCLFIPRRNDYVIAVAVGVICYSFQAFVNLNLPITTPIFWLLMGIGANISLKSKSFK
jgi:hypothetical protein